MKKRHHYIPEFYLRGFADEQKRFYLYLKKEDRIVPSSPKDAFCEKHRNTIRLLKENEREEKILEDLYGKFETKYAPLFQKAKESKYDPRNDVLDIKEKLGLAYFLSTLYWRLPINDSEAEKIIKNGDMKNVGLSLVSKNGSAGFEWLEEVITKIPEAEKIFRIGLTHTLFSNPKNLENTSFWRFSYWNSGFFLTSDNPFIYRKNPTRKNIMNEDFLFPISSKRMLIAGKNIKNFSGNHVPMACMQLIHQSNIVCCEHKEFLEILVKQYKSISDGLRSNLKNFLFEEEGFKHSKL